MQQIDGVVYFCQWGCKQTMGAAQLFKLSLIHICEPVLPFLWVNTVIENGGIAAAMAPDYLNLRLRAASDFFLRRTDGFS